MKKPLILISIVVVAASVWAMYTFGNAAAYFNNDRPGVYITLTPNVELNELPSAHSAPKTEDYLMLSFGLLGLLFAYSVIAATAIKIRKKRK